MQLRSNTFLKFFVTSLFLVEFLSPAFLIGSSPYNPGISRISEISTSNHQGFQFTLFYEQLNENEEEREGDKCLSLPLVLFLHPNNSDAEYSHQINLFPIESSLDVNSKLSLFRLHCVFRI